MPAFVTSIASGAATAAPPPGISASVVGATPASSLLVGVAPTTDAATQQAIAQDVGADDAARVAPSVLELHVASGATPEDAARLRARPDVRYVEPNHAIHSTATPNDPGYPVEWGLQDSQPGIGAPTAWSQTTGSSNIVVGVLDSGIDLTHPDLAPNLWTNPGTVGGCPAGTHGVNEVDADCVPQDDFGHGSHVVRDHRCGREQQRRRRGRELDDEAHGPPRARPER